MSWTPITLDQLTERIAAEVATLSPETAAVFSSLRVTPFSVPCFRSEMAGVERIFVVGKKDDEALIFDDVEDEFGTAMLVRESPIRDWSLCGPLSAAVHAMP